MQENFSKIKYSAICKILCVILAFVTFAFSAWHGVLAFASAYYKFGATYTDTESSDDWTNSVEFYHLLFMDTISSVDTLTLQDEVDYYTEAYRKDKQKFIDEAYKIVLGLKSQAEDNAEDYEIYDEETGELVEESTTIYYGEYSSLYDICVNDFEIFSITLRGDMTKKDIEAKLDVGEKDIANNLEHDYYLRHGNHSLENTKAKFYVSYKGEVNTNTTNFNENDALQSDYYLIIKGGDYKAKGISKTVTEDVYNSFIGNEMFYKDIDLYFYFNAEDLSNLSLTETIDALKKNDYSLLYTLSLEMVKASKHLEMNIALSAVSLLLSFIFAFIYFLSTGKEEKHGETKLFFYDYIPFEIGLSVAGGLGTLAIFGVALFYDTFYLSKILLYILLAASLGCWVLLFMLSASFARNFRSERKFYKYLLTYWVFFAIIKCFKYTFLFIRWVFRAIGKFNRKVWGSAKRTFNAFLFKTHSFKRNILAVTIGWLILNFILFGIICACYVEEFAFGFFVALALIVLDFFTLRKFGEYVKNLDMIIDASSRHEDILVDLETLDLSLKTLAESMRYTNAELQNAIAKAVKDERLRTELITNVSHDLKTPLTSIITYVDLLSKCDIDDEKAQEYIKVLDDKGAKLKRLIDDLIEASKVTSGNVTVNLTPMNLSELCLQATVDVQADFEKAGLDLVVKSGEKPITVIADGTKANRIIENLLSNARKYSAKSSRVYVRVYNEGDYGVFEIKNISAQALDITPEELTERFVRGDKSRNRDGNGLGLSIAKELCKLQNGKLELIIDGDLFKARVKFPNKQ